MTETGLFESQLGKILNSFIDFGGLFPKIGFFQGKMSISKIRI